MKLIRHIIYSILVTLVALNLSAQDYEWGSMPLGGGGFVSAVVAHPTEANLFYARTDVGGIYRWVESTKSWKPLTDWISKADKGLYGIDALGLDPQNPAKLYALAGTSYFSDGKTVIMISDDYGETFTTVDVTSQFKTHGNGEGRHTGEKIAVDPSNSNTIYCGTRYDGLFKSTNGGASWSKVSSLSVSGTSVAGVSFVSIDASSGTIYVGLSKTSNNIWKSTNNGSSWTDITPSAGSGFYPHRGVVANGTLYVTYASDYQSNMSGHNGAVCKYNGSWKTITPSSNHNYGGISVVGNRVLVTSTGDWWTQTWASTGNSTYGDYIYVSDDGGSSWTDLFGSSKVTMSENGNPWVVDHAMHWTGCATLDPNNTKRAFFTSGNGIFATENLSTSSMTLKFMVDGLEETVPLDLTSPTTGGLISVIGDYDGATYVENSSGGFDTPSHVHQAEYGSNYGVDISADGSLAVRLVKSSPYLLYSTNQGSTWTGCSSNQGGSQENGGVAVSANGGTIVYCPGGSSSFYYSTNKGSSWSQCNNISISGGYPVADKVNSSYFYAYNGSNVYYSSDGGKNWKSGGSCATDYTASYKIRTAPDSEGDVWVPCGGNGLYRSTNHASSFSKVSGVSACLAVGFGKAATGKTFPTVYIWGTVNGTEGLFRSVDAGSTWTRINDDAHQFGGPGNSMAVIGDMGTFGTVYMGTVGRGVIYGKVSADQCQEPAFADASLSLCGQESLTLNSQTTSNTNVSYTWYKDDVEISGATGTTYSATEAGVYTVVRDSASCSHEASITITAALPTITLGNDVDICTSTTETLTATLGESVDNLSYAWTYNGTEISGATTERLTVSEAGTYVCQISATNCPSKSDEILVTLSLLDIVADTVCENGGVASLSVATAGDSYAWYASATSSEVLATGAMYEPTITETTTYYVQDNGGVTYTIGEFSVNTESGWNTDDFTGNTSKLLVSVSQACTIESLWVYLVYAYDTPTITVTLTNTETSAVDYTYTSGALTAGSLQEVPVNFAVVPGTYILGFEGSSNGLFLQTEGATYPYGVDDYISVSNYESWATAYVSHVYTMTIKVGSTCVRTPVSAVVDPDMPCPDTEAPDMSGDVTVSENVQNAIRVTWDDASDNTAVTGYEVYLNGELYATTTETSQTFSDLTCETEYTIRIRAYDAAGNYSDYIETTVTTIGTSAPVVAETSLTYAVGDEAEALSVVGESLLWYSDAEGGEGSGSVPTISTESEAVYHYYVSQTVNGCESERVDITVTVIRNTEVQEIALEAGWNLISFYVVPDDASVTGIFTSLDLDIIKNNDGFYKKGIADELQSLQTLQAGEGYLVKMNSAGTLRIEGEPLQNYVSHLSTGWNLLGVPQSDEKAITDLPVSSVIEIKDFDEFYADDDSGTLEQLESGKGYYINVNTDVDIQW